ncbi:MAG: hypothetical protein JSS66_09340 [Armatimonadetes bacterium]|nr:hypothetical protein [Armatimonadota bacterium]
MKRNLPPWLIAVIGSVVVIALVIWGIGALNSGGGATPTPQLEQDMADYRAKSAAQANPSDSQGAPTERSAELPPEAAARQATGQH